MTSGLHRIVLDGAIDPADLSDFGISDVAHDAATTVLMVQIGSRQQMASLLDRVEERQFTLIELRTPSSLR